MTDFLKQTGVRALLVMAALSAGLLSVMLVACFLTWSVVPFYTLMAAGWFPWRMMIALSVFIAIMYTTANATERD